MLIGKNATWAYIVARTKVMKRKLIPKDEFRKLLNMDFNEIVRYLEETEYKREIDELAYKYSGPRLLDYALYLNLSRTYNKIVRVSFGLAKELLTLYLRRWDIWNIINILRGKVANAPLEEIEETIVAAGEKDIEFYKNLMMKEPEEIVKAFEGTPYNEPLSKYGTVSISEIEDELYKIYYNEITKLKPAELSLKLFVDFVKMEVDIKNIKTILRLKVEDVPVEEIMDKIIPNGYELSVDEARKLAAMSWDELTKSLEGYWFWKGVEIEKEFSTIEVEFDKAWIEAIARKASNYPLSILPVLQYMVLKKVEIDNLRILGWGKWQNIPNEEIERQLVIV